MTTGKFVPDNLEPVLEEIDMGSAKQLIVRYTKPEPEQKILDVIQFLPRKMLVQKNEKTFPWHDVLVYAITMAPFLGTLIFAEELIKANAFMAFGLTSVLWFWFVFMINTKLRGVFR